MASQTTQFFFQAIYGFMGQTHYPSKSWVLRVVSLAKLDIMVNWNLIFNTKLDLYKMVVAPQCSQPYLCTKPPIHSPQKILSSTSANFHLPISCLLVPKAILTTATNTPFPYASAIFHQPIFAYSYPYNLHQKTFLYLRHLANAVCVEDWLSSSKYGQGKQGSKSLISSRSGSKNWCIAGSSL